MVLNFPPPPTGGVEENKISSLLIGREEILSKKCITVGDTLFGSLSSVATEGTIKNIPQTAVCGIFFIVPSVATLLREPKSVSPTVIHFLDKISSLPISREEILFSSTPPVGGGGKFKTKSCSSWF